LEIRVNTNSEKLKIDNDVKNLEELWLKIISNIKEKLDCCYDKNGSSAQIGSESIWNAIAQLKYKGTKLRLITEITKENITYCKTMMRYFDVRHMDDVKGNFGIFDGAEYLGNMLAFDGKHEIPLIHIYDKSFVKLQQYLFDTLWSKAIQSQEKIKEIELGLDKEFIETMKEPLEIQQLVHDLLKSATYEILILFSTANSFYRAKKENILGLLKESDVNDRISKTVGMEVISAIPCYCDIQFSRKEFLTVLKHPNHPFTDQIEHLSQDAHIKV
jgi:hypothetical protein